jgi:hypothetical protein
MFAENQNVDYNRAYDEPGTKPVVYSTRAELRNFDRAAHG